MITRFIHDCAHWLAPLFSCTVCVCQCVLMWVCRVYYMYACVWIHSTLTQTRSLKASSSWCSCCLWCLHVRQPTHTHAQQPVWQCRDYFLSRYIDISPAQYCLHLNEESTIYACMDGRKDSVQRCLIKFITCGCMNISPSHTSCLCGT